MRFPEQASPQGEWVPEKAVCAIRFHVRLVSLLLEKLDLPYAQLQELRVSCRRGCKVHASINEGEVWQNSPVGLYRSVELHCPLWSRLWTSALAREAGESEEMPVPATTLCLSRQERELLDEVEIHSSAGLRHLAHASSHLHDVGEQFTKDLTRLQVRSKEEEAGGENLNVDEAASAGTELTARFRNCLDSYAQVLWTFFLHVQLVNAIFHGDTLLTAAWALRLLGLSGPWSLRRLHDFVLCGLELLMESSGHVAEETGEPHDAREMFLAACETYLAVPVIPRMQSRMQSCVTSLRRSGLLPEDRLKQVLSEVESGGSTNFDSSGSGLHAIRDRDAVHNAFQRSLRESVIGRVDRLCPLDVRENLLASFRELAAPPLVRPARAPWPAGPQCQLLLEVLASVPEHGERRSKPTFPGRFLEILEEETPGEKRVDDTRPPVVGQSEALSSFFCSGVCSGKALE